MSITRISNCIFIGMVLILCAAFLRASAYPAKSDMDDVKHEKEVYISIKYNITFDKKLSNVSPDVIKATRQAILYYHYKSAVKYMDGYVVNNDAQIYDVRQTGDNRWDVYLHVKPNSHNDYDKESVCMAAVEHQSDPILKEKTKLIAYFDGESPNSCLIYSKYYGVVLNPGNIDKIPNMYKESNDYHEKNQYRRMWVRNLSTAANDNYPINLFINNYIDKEKGLKSEKFILNTTAQASILFYFNSAFRENYHYACSTDILIDSIQYEKNNPYRYGYIKYLNKGEDSKQYDFYTEDDETHYFYNFISLLKSNDGLTYGFISYIGQHEEISTPQTTY